MTPEQADILVDPLLMAEPEKMAPIVARLKKNSASLSNPARRLNAQTPPEEPFLGRRFVCRNDILDSIAANSGTEHVLNRECSELNGIVRQFLLLKKNLGLAAQLCLIQFLRIGFHLTDQKALGFSINRDQINFVLTFPIPPAADLIPLTAFER